MAFSKEVKINALVAAARHCCVCHRYKGVKVEVHHIIPVSEGGTDEAENAIALCFDCHADAGHYNPQHPRGIKFSPEELRHARDEWNHRVKENRTNPPIEEVHLYVRYFVCKSYSAIREICEGLLENIPAQLPFLIKNGVYDFQAYIIESSYEENRQTHVWGKVYETRDEYIKKHRNAHILDRTGRNYYPYFEAIRQPSHNELKKRVAPYDFVTSLLLDEDVAPSEISNALAYYEMCGDEEGFQEIYRIRPLWVVYLAISNISDQPIQLKTLLCEYEDFTQIRYRPFIEPRNVTLENIALPPAPIPPNGTVIIPIATLLGPLDGTSPELFWEDMADISTGEVQTIGHGDGSAIVNKTAMIGPALWPKSIKFASSASNIEQQIHDFDLSNLYIINRFWECGSCPHLFLANVREKKYWGELFTEGPNRIQKNDIIIPHGFDSLIIVELESEISRIVTISINGKPTYTDITLYQNEQLRIPVTAGDHIHLTGYYVPLHRDKKIQINPWQKNKIIFSFMRQTLNE